MPEPKGRWARVLYWFRIESYDEPYGLTDADARVADTAPELLAALKSCADLVTDAVDQKLLTGRWPPVGALLSTIKSTARAAIIKAQEKEGSHEHKPLS